MNGCKFMKSLCGVFPVGARNYFLAEQQRIIGNGSGRA